MRWRRRKDAVASCREVMRALQAYLDGHIDERDARRVAVHLADCRRCGLEAAVYREIKQALARAAREVSPLAVSRLREFGRRLADVSSA